jgi:hypothetical protein
VVELVCEMADQRQAEPEPGRVVSGRHPAAVVGYLYVEPLLLAHGRSTISVPRSPIPRNACTTALETASETASATSPRRCSRTPFARANSTTEWRSSATLDADAGAVQDVAGTRMNVPGRAEREPVMGIHPRLRTYTALALWPPLVGRRYASPVAVDDDRDRADSAADDLDRLDQEADARGRAAEARDRAASRRDVRAAKTPDATAAPLPKTASEHALPGANLHAEQHPPQSARPTTGHPVA